MKSSPQSMALSSPLARLPLALVQSVFAFADDANACTKADTFAKVSKEWHAYAQDLISAEILSTLTIPSKTTRRVATSRSALVELRRQLTLRGPHLRTLTLEARGAIPAASLDVWTLVFVHTPHVERLSFWGSHLSSLLWIAPILQVAVLRCPQLRSLSLPAMATLPLTGSKTVLTALLETLKQSPGIQDLSMTMPFLEMADHSTQATQYVQALARHCPNIRSLRNDDANTVDRYRSAREQWHISTETWNQFCASCTQLVAFDWAVVPFATAFFEVFGWYAKPKLESLTLGSPAPWSWDACLRDQPMLTSGFGDTARNPQAVLRACPALRDLRIYLLVDESVRAPTDVERNLFGDDFCKTLAKCCPRLERFELLSDTNSWLSAPPIASLTDQALYALATLPMLTTVSVRAVNITGDGVFALVVETAASEWKMQRDFNIAVGERAGRTPKIPVFDDVAKRFLTRLAEWPDDEPLPCASTRVVMRLANRTALSTSDRVWRGDSVVKLRSLLEAAKHKHPRIELRVEVMFPQYDDNDRVVAFSSLVEIGFYTVGAEIPRRWTKPSHEPVTDVFEDFMGSDFDGGSDEDDEAFDPDEESDISSDSEDEDDSMDCSSDDDDDDPMDSSCDY